MMIPASMEIHITKGRFGFGWIEGIAILVNPLDWAYPDWVEYCELLASLGEATHHYSVGLNYAPGRGPTDEEVAVHTQYLPRARLHRLRRVALMTDNQATEAAQGAAVDVMPARFPWRPCPIAQLDDAFNWLHEQAPFDVDGARRLLTELSRLVYSP